MQTISWIKDSFSLNHTFFLNGEVIGFIEDSTMSKASRSSILGKKFVFETKGLIRHTVNMIDITDRKIIGYISYSSMWPKATIDLEGNNYTWKRANIFTSAWKIVDQNDRTILISSNRKNGTFQSIHPDYHLLMITGLFIKNRFYKMGM